jgi:hypothetical protein
MSFAIGMVTSLLVEVVDLATHQPWLFVVVPQALNAPLTALSIAWACVYSLDARIRLEGLDLQAEANRLL